MRSWICFSWFRLLFLNIYEHTGGNELENLGLRLGKWGWCSWSALQCSPHRSDLKRKQTFYKNDQLSWTWGHNNPGGFCLAARELSRMHVVYIWLRILWAPQLSFVSSVSSDTCIMDANCVSSSFATFCSWRLQVDLVVSLLTVDHCQISRQGFRPVRCANQCYTCSAGCEHMKFEFADYPDNFGICWVSCAKNKTSKMQGCKWMHLSGAKLVGKFGHFSLHLVEVFEDCSRFYLCQIAELVLWLNPKVAELQMTGIQFTSNLFCVWHGWGQTIMSVDSPSNTTTNLSVHLAPGAPYVVRSQLMVIWRCRPGLGCKRVNVAHLAVKVVCG